MPTRLEDQRGRHPLRVAMISNDFISMMHIFFFIFVILVRH
jgi:hypothetical protein